MLIKANAKKSSCKSSKFIGWFLIGVGVLFVGGCQEKAQIQTEKKSAPLESSIKRQNAALQAENQQLKEQLETLMGIDKSLRLEAFSAVSQIELGDRCGIYDKNDDGVAETLIVYLKVIDDTGDVIKAVGAAKIELWNLNAAPENARLGSWEIEPAELKKNWSGSLLTNYFKIKLDVSDIVIGKVKELTVKTEFTDFLTGKILTAQQVIQ